MDLVLIQFGLDPQGGQIGFVLARKGDTKSCRIPVRPCDFQSDLKWYSRPMHRAAFTLPYYIQKMLTQLDSFEGQGDNGFDDDEDDGIDECLLAGCNIQ